MAEPCHWVWNLIYNIQCKSRAEAGLAIGDYVALFSLIAGTLDNSVD
jgi:hypothetical protein